MAIDQSEANLPSISKFLKSKIDASDRSQKDIARDIGYSNANNLSMMKTGVTKVPLEKVPLVAKVLQADLGYLMRLALEQYWPNKSDEIWSVFENIASSNEMKLIRFLREAYDDLDPSFTEPQIRAVVALLTQLNPPSRHRESHPT